MQCQEADPLPLLHLLVVMFISELLANERSEPCLPASQRPFVPFSSREKIVSKAPVKKGAQLKKDCSFLQVLEHQRTKQ